VESKPGANDELLVFAKWMDFLAWLLPATAKFPRSARFSFAQRIDSIALDVVEDLVEARYSRDRSQVLRRANLRIEKLRVLLRLSHTLEFISHEAFRHAARSVDEAGRMLGGWMKHDDRG
jgi:hypothetical protein